MAARERALLGVESQQGAALVAKRAQVVRATSRSALLYVIYGFPALMTALDIYIYHILLIKITDKCDHDS